jgi:hypothetical protein
VRMCGRSIATSSSQMATSTSSHDVAGAVFSSCSSPLRSHSSAVEQSVSVYNSSSIALCTTTTQATA